MENILIIYAGIGHGHKKIAENIGTVLKTENNVDLFNLMDLEKGQLSEDGSKFYYWMLKSAPWLWNFFYTNKVFISLTLPLRTFVAGFKTSAAKNLLKQKKYDIVISTHVNSSAVISYLKKKNRFAGKFVITFSDFHLHRYWLFDNADLYIANIPEQKIEMLRFGIPEQKILVCGITLAKEQQVDASTVKSKYGIEENGKVILVVGGSMGFGLEQKTIEGLKNINAKIIIVCGSNKVAQQTFARIYKDNKKIIVLGYVDNMPELYAISNVVVTKPGGLSTTECLQKMLPIVVQSFMPGQEEINMDYLLKNNLVLDGRNDLAVIVKKEIETGNFVAQLKNNPVRKALVGDGSIINKAISGL